MRTKIYLFPVLSLFLFAVSCMDQTDPGRADIKFFLTDMPDVYQEVNVEIMAVQVKMNDTLIELCTNQGIYNILEYVNGKDTLIVDDQIPAGTVSQIRLILVYESPDTKA